MGPVEPGTWDLGPSSGSESGPGEALWPWPLFLLLQWGQFLGRPADRRRPAHVTLAGTRVANQPQRRPRPGGTPAAITGQGPVPSCPPGLCTPRPATWLLRDLRGELGSPQLSGLQGRRPGSSRCRAGLSADRGCLVLGRT